MTVILWRVDNGKPHLFEYAVDANEALAGGHYTSDRPQEQPEKKEEFSVQELRKIAAIAERERLGSPIAAEDRLQLEEYRATDEKLSPAAPKEIPAPETTAVEDTFNPALASRAELFSWLGENAEPAPSAMSTVNLRQRVYERLGMKTGE